MEMCVRCCWVPKVPCSIRNIRAFDEESLSHPNDITCLSLKISCPKLTRCQVFIGKATTKYISRRARCVPVSVEDSLSVDSENDPTDKEPALEDSPADPLARPLSNDELKALLADTERAKLLRKLSEANQQNRFLKRQLQVKEEALVNLKSELADTELNIQAINKLAEEIANSAIPEGTRKINGKYIQSHLLSKLEAVLEKLREQIKDVGVAQSKEVPISFYGVAESVQVMGTFDGWSQGEYLSPEYTGSYNRFSTTLLLRPGRYEIKFLVDGEWQLSPEFPTVGEGLMKNNLLVVE